MRTRLSVGCTVLCSALLLCCALVQTVRGSQLSWERIDVEAHLDNAGALHVRERMAVIVDGKLPMLDRRIVTSTDQIFVLQRLVREENGRERQLKEGWDKKDHYMWRDGTLTWWIRDETDPAWKEQTLVFRFDYELRNAMAPEWDILAGPDSFQYSRDRFPRFSERLGADL